MKRFFCLSSSRFWSVSLDRTAFKEKERCLSRPPSLRPFRAFHKEKKQSRRTAKSNLLLVEIIATIPSSSITSNAILNQTYHLKQIKYNSQSRLCLWSGYFQTDHYLYLREKTKGRLRGQRGYESLACFWFCCCACCCWSCLSFVIPCFANGGGAGFLTGDSISNTLKRESNI